MAFYECLWRVIAQILNGDFFLKLLYIIIETENEENLFSGKKIALVSVVTLNYAQPD